MVQDSLSFLYRVTSSMWKKLSSVLLLYPKRMTSALHAYRTVCCFKCVAFSFISIQDYCFAHLIRSPTCAGLLRGLCADLTGAVGWELGGVLHAGGAHPLQSRESPHGISSSNPTNSALKAVQGACWLPLLAAPRFIVSMCAEVA